MPSADGMSPAEQLAKVDETARQLIADQGSASGAIWTVELRQAPASAS